MQDIITNMLVCVMAHLRLGITCSHHGAQSALQYSSQTVMSCASWFQVQPPHFQSDCYAQHHKP